MIEVAQDDEGGGDVEPAEGGAMVEVQVVAHVRKHAVQEMAGKEYILLGFYSRCFGA